MKRTVDEKLRYNETQNSMFSVGYVVGVKNYRNYPKCSEDVKQNIDGIVRAAKAGVKDASVEKDMQQLYKGVLCGIRDAANERKKRSK